MKFSISIQVGDDTNDKLLQCRCNHLTAFGGGFVIAPNPIDFDKVFTEFSRLGETGNYLVPVMVCAIFGVYLVVLIWARKADMLDERKVNFIVLIYFIFEDMIGRSHLFPFDLFYQMEVVLVPVFEKKEMNRVKEAKYAIYIYDFLP